MGFLKDMMSSHEFTGWAAEYTLRAEDEEMDEMQGRVNAEAQGR